MNGDLDYYSKVSIPYQEVVTRVKMHTANWQESLTFNVKKLYSDPGPTLSSWFDSAKTSVQTGLTDVSEKIRAMSDSTIVVFNRWVGELGVVYDQSVTSFGLLFNRLSADPLGELSALFFGLTNNGQTLFQKLNVTAQALPAKLDSTWSNTQVLLDHSYNLTVSFLSQSVDTIWLFLTGFIQQPGVSMNVVKYDLLEFGINLASSILGYVLKII